MEIIKFIIIIMAFGDLGILWVIGLLFFLSIIFLCFLFIRSRVPINKPVELNKAAVIGFTINGICFLIQLLFLIIVMTGLIDEKIYEISLLFNIIFLFLPFGLGIIGSFTCLFSLFFYKKRKTYFGILGLYFAVLILASSFLVLLLLH